MFIVLVQVVEEHQAFGVQLALHASPATARRAMFLTRLLAGPEGLFERSAELAQGFHIVPVLIEMPCAPSSQAHFRRS